MCSTAVTTEGRADVMLTGQHCRCAVSFASVYEDV